MATYSTSLKLTLIGDGEQTGTWGSTTNTNFGTLLEQAIVGQTSITMINADYTLTNLNGSLDEARSAVIIVGGNQNATYSVIVPAVPKLYMVYNNLNASATAYIKMSGGTTTQVPNGQTMYLYCTGLAGASWGVLNYVQNAQNLVTGGTINTGAITCTSLTGGTVAGTTITASTQFTGPGTGLTGTAGSLIASNISGTLAVNQGGTGATAKTGTGDNVLSTSATLLTPTLNSPTFTTPVLGTPTSGNLANCTGYPAGSITGTVNLATQVTGTLAVANGGTGVTSSTGTSSVVLSASPTLTGTPLAPTAASSTSTTQIATTAFVQAVVQALYPIGSIYSSTSATNPQATFGFGTWIAYAAGRVLVGAGGTFSGTGGSADSIVVSHNHTGTTDNPNQGHFHGVIGNTAGQNVNHNHTFGGDDQVATQGGYSVVSNFPYDATSTGSGGGANMLTTDNSTDHSHFMNFNTGDISQGHTHTFTTASAGASGTNANMQPYVVVYMWTRTS
jgi:hypothetical protein